MTNEIDRVIGCVLCETLESARAILTKKFPDWRIEKVEENNDFRIFNPLTAESVVIKTKE